MPTCPKCGGELKLRTAKRGANAGKQFYGCANWKKNGTGCDFTIDKKDFEQNISTAIPTPSESAPVSQNVSSNLRVAISLCARAKFRSHSVKFFQTMALPRSVMNAVQTEGDDFRQPWERYTAWRLDLPPFDIFDLD